MIITTRISEIHIGERTHHHDQLMYPSIFKVIKTMVSNPVKPIPPDEELPNMNKIMIAKSNGLKRGAITNIS